MKKKKPAKRSAAERWRGLTKEQQHSVHSSIWMYESMTHSAAADAIANELRARLRAEQHAHRIARAVLREAGKR